MTAHDREESLRFARAVQRLNSTIDNRLALIEPDRVCLQEVPAQAFGDIAIVECDLFRVTLSSSEVHDDLTDLEALDLAKWWCSLHT
ncbi:hypothetical protein [Nocardia thailandica]